MRPGNLRQTLERALQIIREPLTHRKYASVMRENLDDSPPLEKESLSSRIQFTEARSYSEFDTNKES